MKFSVLASGSKGNLTYIESKYAKIIIDAGISYREATKRALQLNINLDDIDAIVITHEHRDHIGFLPSFLKRTQATLYINKDSLLNMNGGILERLDGYKVKFIEADKPFKIKDLTIVPLLLSHDSINCFGFHIINEHLRLTYITDTGFLPVKYFDHLADSHAIIIESNHDIELLHESNRPIELKRRILSAQGHMSNRICSQIIKAIISPKIKYIVLAHLSEEVNTSELALGCVYSMIEPIYYEKILVAKQHEALQLLSLE